MVNFSLNFLWGKDLDSTLDDVGRFLCHHDDGNVYVAGHLPRDHTSVHNAESCHSSHLCENLKYRVICWLHFEFSNFQ